MAVAVMVEGVKEEAEMKEMAGERVEALMVEAVAIEVEVRGEVVAKEAA